MDVDPHASQESQLFVAEWRGGGRWEALGGFSSLPTLDVPTLPGPGALEEGNPQ